MARATTTIHSAEAGVSPTAPPLLVAAFGLALGPAIGLGLGRFAFALLLPSMRADLGWTYAQAGGVNTANAFGYLLGALLAAPLGARWGSKPTYVGGLAVTTLALLACAATDSFALLLALRFLTGAAGAVSFVVGGGLAARAGQARRPGQAGLLLGLYFGGGGLGIVVSGLAVPPVLSAGGPHAWRLGWLVLGLTAVLALAASVAVLRRLTESPVRASGGPPLRSFLHLAPTFATYTLFGMGYIAYMTFIVAFLRGQGRSAGTLALFWVALGVAATVCPFLWGRVLSRLRAGWGPAITLAAVSVGAALPLVANGAAIAFASAIVFGGSFLAVVAAVMEIPRRTLPSGALTASIGALTVAFSAGQCLGPVLAGVLSDGPSGIRAGLSFSVAVLLIAALVALGQRERTVTTTTTPAIDR